MMSKSLLNLFTALLIGVWTLGISSCTQQSKEENKTALSEEDAALVLRMKDASVPEIKAFIREVLDQKLPENYEIPEPIIQAGSPSEATRVVGERYPEFVNKQGADFLASIAAHPIRYKQMIMESRAIRKHYHNVIYNELEKTN